MSEEQMTPEIEQLAIRIADLVRLVALRASGQDEDERVDHLYEATKRIVIQETGVLMQTQEELAALKAAEQAAYAALGVSDPEDQWNYGPVALMCAQVIGKLQDAEAQVVALKAWGLKAVDSIGVLETKVATLTEENAALKQQSEPIRGYRETAMANEQARIRESGVVFYNGDTTKAYEVLPAKDERLKAEQPAHPDLDEAPCTHPVALTTCGFPRSRHTDKFDHPFTTKGK